MLVQSCFSGSVELGSRLDDDHRPPSGPIGAKGVPVTITVNIASPSVVLSGKSVMKFRKISMRCAGLAILIGVFLSTHPVSAQGFKWWQSDTFTRELGLTSDQSTKIEAIFQRTLPALRTQKGALDKAEADFNQMVEASDDAQVMAQVGVVEAARSELNKSRTMMLLRMRRVLTPDQRVKFVMLQEKTRDRRRAGDDHKQ